MRQESMSVSGRCWQAACCGRQLAGGQCVNEESVEVED